MHKGNRKLAALLGLIALVACGNPPGRLQSAPVERVRSFEPSTTPLPGLISEAREFDQSSNRGRREVLTSLLHNHNLDYELQLFKIEPDDDRPARQGCNVVVSFGGRSRGLVIGAHFDAAPLPDERISPGMVDNAAAVVVLIRLAEALRHVRLSNRVYVVFFDAEEIGLVGSSHFVRAFGRDSLDLMINLDIAGYGDTVLFGPSLGKERPELKQALRDSCSRLGIDCLASPRLPPGDHESFRSAGVPSISIALLPGREAHQAWLMFNWPEASGLREGFAPPVARIIHSENDLSENLDPAAMTMAFNLLGTLLVALDGRFSQE